LKEQPQQTQTGNDDPRTTEIAPFRVPGTDLGEIVFLAALLSPANYRRSLFPPPCLLPQFSDSAFESFSKAAVNYEKCPKRTIENI
jgi:hypothetical protein